MNSFTIDLSNFYNFIHAFFYCIPHPFMAFLGIIAMFTIVNSFRSRFGGGKDD